MNRVLADILAVLCCTAATFLGAAYFELHEAFSRWVSAYEHWQLDELPLTVLALASALSWFALRRWRDAVSEIGRRVAAERRIAELANRNRDLARELIVAQEQERRALARELHDELGQMCNAIHVEAAYIVNLAGRDPAAAAATEPAKRIADSAQGLYRLVRGMLNRLRPAALDQLGLVPALEGLCEDFEARNRIACSFVGDEIAQIDDASAIALYRIAQEALLNVARHAGASRVEIRLRREAAENAQGRHERLVLTVDDDGRGIEKASARPGFGLLGMQERVAALGGALALDSAPGRGLCLRTVIPAGGAA
ncbi:MAG TPA: histidine kinase [Burkholderiales bacterium]|jgi:two-component system sensor histidine kinase UhpB